MRNKGLLAAGLALALAWSTPAAAETILFDVNGSAAGGFMQADVFDWLPGNSLLVENATGTAGTVYFQANLGTITGPPPGPSGDFANGTCAVGDCNFKVVAGFGVTIVTVGPTAILSFDAANTTNFFKVYVDDTAASDLTGSCFVCGTEILSGTALPVGFSGIFTITGGPDDPLVDGNGDGNPLNDGADRALDQFNVNNYPGLFTVAGVGATAVTVEVDSFDSSYFLNLIANQTLTFTNTSQIDPYNQADPSEFFTNNGVTDANEPGAPSTGPINGISTNRLVAQSDANTSFQGVQAVPEPATLTLLGLGLAGSALRRRQAQKAKA